MSGNRKLYNAPRIATKNAMNAVDKHFGPNCMRFAESDDHLLLDAQPSCAQMKVMSAVDEAAYCRTLTKHGRMNASDCTSKLRELFRQFPIKRNKTLGKLASCACASVGLQLIIRDGIMLGSRS
eukprot:4623584-Amphidinium_carterae.1